MIEFVRGAFGVSIRKACRAIPTCHATYHYRSRRPTRAGAPEKAHPRGRRDACALRLLANNGIAAACTPTSHGASYATTAATQPGPNQMDWMHDELFDGRRLWILTVVEPIGDRDGGHRCA